MKYPYGSLQPGRHGNSGDYRYGYIGAENDNEILGVGNSQDHLFRNYDVRLARYKSLDPLSTKFPALSPFQYSGNNPIAAFDLEGLEPATVNPNTETLIIVLQGYGGDPQDGKTQAQNAGGALGIDAAGLGQIAQAAEGSTKIQVVTFASSTTKNTKENIKLTLYRHYANTEGKGRVIVVGHSQGADNAVELFGEYSELTADLLILLDIKDASGNGILFIDEDNIGSNIKNVINYYQTGEFIGGEKIDIDDESKTNGANILSPGSNHRSIDNDLVPYIIKDINNIIQAKDPVKEAKNRKLPIFNPNKTSSDDITGKSKSTAGPKSGS
ncbi:RHS repeat-associated core domain-containing protein [Christiangramia sp. SM2212]|uniref:RHS repeat-associated core domain-containing protein n=1 Tax=Christiangramia sediminicola TaxID=3073267 RepID=A0ABU1ETE4_9FLAO|nr:RHS repeat-associated core domain-containing protein [Christiangramia sp. SM2212]MDR5591672.1 RHS repeat-associated core domain-containing protein [Christiangramia sp. SM2212]